MFAIYDIDGRSFRDTLENLQKVKKCQSAGRAALMPRGEERNNSDKSGSSTSEKDAYKSAQAHQAYREKINIGERASVIHAHQIMSRPVETIQLTQDIVSAWGAFQLIRRHQLPVLDFHQRIVGMLTERDLLQFLIIEDGQIKTQINKTVADAMLGQVITADPVTDVRRIAKVMLDYGQSAVPITNEQDALIGLVSRSDILRAVALDPPLSLWT